MRMHRLVTTALVTVALAVDFQTILYEPTNVQDTRTTPYEKYIESPSRPEELIELVRLYSEQHSVHVLMTESDDELCQRKFVSNYHFKFGCQSFGNNLGSILNNVVYALAVNRTYLANDLSYLHESCQGYVSLFPWVPTVDEIHDRLSKSKCPLPLDILISFGDPKPGYSASSHRIVSGDGLFNAAFDHLLRDSTLDPFLRRRAHLLTGVENKNGRYEAYGMVSRQFFNFSSNVHKLVDKCTQSIGENALVVGLHLRHKDASDSGRLLNNDFDDRGLAILKELRGQHTYGKCVVYLATDRNATIDRVTTSANSINCSVVSISRFLLHNPSPELSQSHSGPTDRKEHGPWGRGLIQVADVVMMAKVRYFIGSKDSTFSNFMANYVAARNLLEGIREEYLYFTDCKPQCNGPLRKTKSKRADGQSDMNCQRSGNVPKRSKV